jgi:hypothetical protein
MFGHIFVFSLHLENKNKNMEIVFFSFIWQPIFSTILIKFVKHDIL